MTLVTVDLGKPDAGGVLPDDTRVGFQPTRRRNAGTTVVLPKAFSVVPVGGIAVVQLAPTGPDWCWRITEYAGQDGTVRHVAVPDADAEDYVSLIDVDPSTLDPAAVPEAAWWAFAEGMAVSGEQAAQAATTAVSAAGVASGAASTATGAAGASQDSATAAAASAGDAAAAAGVAGGHASTATTKAGEAANSATAAAGSATNAAGSANAASNSANTAGGHATTAGNAATTAQDAATTATTKAGEAAASATTAQQWATGFTAGTATPLAAGAAPTLAITGPAGAKVLDLGIPAGGKGDPGGWVRATILAAGVNANSVTAPGLYTAIGVNTTLALNFPFDQVAVNIAVIERDANIRTQTAYVVALGANSQKGIAQRSNISGLWGEWDYYVPTLTSQAAGRTISTWDSINRRYQLTHGDTGTRDISDLLEAATGVRPLLAQIRRIGYEVFLEIIFPNTLPTTTGLSLGAFPAGFQGQPGAGGSRVIGSRGGTTIVFSCTSTGNTQLLQYSPTTSEVNIFGSYSTRQAWPATLPGVPVGTIPNL